MAGTFRCAVRYVDCAPNHLLLLADAYFHSGSLISTIWLCVVALLVIIRRGERLPLTSVGIGTCPWWKSILWGLAMTIICALMAFGIVHATHYGGADNPTVAAFSKLPVWLLVFIIFRAGVVEELFYRGYAIERLESLGLNRFWAVVIPLTIFAICTLDRRLG